MTIQHQFNDPKADGADATIARPSDWNADHVVTDIVIQGLARKISGDLSNATVSNRVLWQSSTVNGATSIAAIPNGTALFSQWQAYDAADTLNAGRASFAAITSEARISQDKFGTASYGPITFYTSGAERMRLDASGNFGVGTSTPNYAGYTVAATIQGATNCALELVSTRADAIATIGALECNYRTNSTGHQRIANIGFVTEGATANQRGGSIHFLTKPDGSTSVTDRGRFGEAGHFISGQAATGALGQVTSDSRGSGSTYSYTGTDGVNYTFGVLAGTAGGGSMQTGGTLGTTTVQQMVNGSVHSTFNASGLGVGVSPGTKLDVNGVARATNFRCDTATVGGAGTETTIDCSSTSTVLTNGSTVSMAKSGLFAVADLAVDGAMALFLVSGGVVTLISQTTTLYVVGAPAAGKVGLGFNVLGTGLYDFKNNSGVSRTFKTSFIMLRAAT